MVSGLGRIVSNATATIGRGIVILFAYRAALKRLEAGVEGDLFDEPVLWAELKSVAWAEAGAVDASRSKARPVRTSGPKCNLRLPTDNGCFTSSPAV